MPTYSLDTLTILMGVNVGNLYSNAAAMYGLNDSSGYVIRSPWPLQEAKIRLRMRLGQNEMLKHVAYVKFKDNQKFILPVGLFIRRKGSVCGYTVMQYGFIILSG